MLNASISDHKEVTGLITIDSLDAAILRRLNENARAGVADIAGRLKVARNTVQARLKRLEDTGVIEAFRPTIDLESAGVVVQAFVALELDQRLLADVVSALARVPHVLEVNTQAGREDLLVRVGAPTHPELQRVVTAMIDIPAVRHTTTTLIVSTPLRYRTQPLIDEVTRGAGFGRSTSGPR